MSVTMRPANAPKFGRTKMSFDQWRDTADQLFIPLVVEADKSAFSALASARRFGDIVVCDLTAARHEVYRTTDHLTDGDRYFKLSLQLSGTGLLVQDDRHALLRPGDIAIYDTNRPYTLQYDGEFRSVVLMFSHHMLDLPRDHALEMTAQRVERDEPLAAPIASVVSHVVSNLTQLQEYAGFRLMHNVVDLLSTVLRERLGANLDGQSSHREALLQTLRLYIEANLSDPALRPSMIANANYISPRHLHGLFKDSGTTVSSWIRDQRLERCRLELSDPLLAFRPVSAIGARWGLVDAPHFSKLFKMATGESPTDYRQRVLSGTGDSERNVV